jgi:hypothetical protein
MLHKIFIDTLFVAALINLRDQYHKKAMELSKLYEGYPLFTTDLVLLEIGNGLARNFRNVKLINLPIVNIANQFRFVIGSL